MSHLLVKEVSKSFKGILKPVLDNFSFQLNRGCYSVLGPNGIGKTTLLSLLAGVEKPDKGKISLTNIGVSSSLEYKKNLAYVPSAPCFFPMASGIDFLKFICAAKSVKYTQNIELEKMINSFNLQSHLSKRFADMSLGTQKKLFLCTLAIGKNNLIVLDEPSVGLDQVSLFEIASLLNFFSKNAIVIIATHDTQLLDSVSYTGIKFNSYQHLEILHDNPI